jgi:hypothetical protein
MMSEPDEFSESGDPIFRYEAPSGEEGVSDGDPELIEGITSHVERHLGPIEQVFHELASPIVHVDIHWVTPSRDRPWHTLVTSGMAERRMSVPDGRDDLAYAELMVTLPADWRIGQEAFRDEVNYWPIRWLKILARFPHEYATWLGYAHTIPNGDPPEPFAPSTKLSGMMLMPPLQVPEDFAELTLSPNRNVRFWSLLPLHAEEMELKLQEGSDALLERLDHAGVTDVVDPKRENVAVRKRWWPFS